MPGPTSLDAVFRPRSIAVIGASPKPNSIGRAIMENLVDDQFQGVVFPVNPRYEHLNSMKCYPTVSAIPDPVDLAIVIVPAKFVLDVVNECLAAGVKGFVIISAGFKEIGEDGAAQEARLADMLKAAGARTVGPNCMGVINTEPGHSMHATFAPMRPLHGDIGFISQSGALGVALLIHADELNLGVRQFASIGNKMDVTSNDLLEYWEDDPAIKLVLMYLENFGAPRRFAEVARRITRKKPVIAMKSGRSAAGARATASHTGALGGMDAATQALFDQCGILRANSIQELFDMGLAFHTQPLPRGNRVAILTNAGGPGVLAADQCEAEGLSVPELSPASTVRLRERVSPNAGIKNPIDLTAAGDAAQFRFCMEVLQEDPNIDAIIAIFLPPIPAEAPAVAAAIRQATSGSDKPTLSCFLAEEAILETMTQPPGEAECRVPMYRYPEDIAKTLSAMRRYRQFLDRPASAAMTAEDVDRPRARAVIDAARAKGKMQFTPGQAREILGAYGFPLAEENTLPSAPLAAAYAESLGRPVALKYIHPDASHKSDMGLVQLGVEPGDVRAAAERMDQTAQELLGSRGEFLVQEMIPPGRELILGITQDPAFGPVVMAGLGGVHVEVWRDVAFRVPPVSADEARDLLQSLRGYKILSGVRGEAAIDLDYAVELIGRLAQLATENPEIAEMDMNPLIAFPERGDFRVVDVRATLRGDAVDEKVLDHHTRVIPRR